jgi:hypothetical protein
VSGTCIAVTNYLVGNLEPFACDSHQLKLPFADNKRIEINAKHQDEHAESHKTKKQKNKISETKFYHKTTYAVE